MTNLEFKTRYQLLKKVSDGRLSTYHALAANGAVVMVHILDATATDEHARVLALIDRLGPDDRQRILTIDEVDGAPLIVTRFLLDFRDLGEWLDASVLPAQREAARQIDVEFSPEPPPVALVPHPSEARPASEPGPSADVERPAARPAAAASTSEFTAMFGRPLGEVPSPAEPAGANRPAHESRDDSLPPPAMDPASTGPGEFTRMFRAPAPVPPAADAVPAAPTASPPASEAMPRASAPPPPAAEATPHAPAPPPRAAEARPPAPAAPAAPIAAEHSSPAPSPTARSGPGEFTMIFGAAAPPGPPPTAPEPTPASVPTRPSETPPPAPFSATQARGQTRPSETTPPVQATATPARGQTWPSETPPAAPPSATPARGSTWLPDSPPAPPAAPPGPGRSAGAGEFTRVFGAPQRAPEPNLWEPPSSGPIRPAAPPSDDYLARLGASPPPRPAPPPPPPSDVPEPAANPWNLDLPRPPAPPRQSEFTRVISTPSRPEAAGLPAGVAYQGGPAAAAPGAAPAKPPSRVGLIVGLVLVAILATVAVVLLVVLTR
jgi:hypothetical protein